MNVEAVLRILSNDKTTRSVILKNNEGLLLLSIMVNKDILNYFKVIINEKFGFMEFERIDNIPKDKL